MRQHRPSEFQETQVFRWETETAEERPTGFEHSSFVAASGYYAIHEKAHATRGRRHGHRGWFNSLVLGGATIFALSVWGLYGLASVLRS